MSSNTNTSTEEEKMREHEERGNITRENVKKDEDEDDDIKQAKVDADVSINVFRRDRRVPRRMRSLTWPPCLPNHLMLASISTTINKSDEETTETPPGERDTNTSVAFDELVDEILEDEALERIFQSIVDADIGGE